MSRSPGRCTATILAGVLAVLLASLGAAAPAAAAGETLIGVGVAPGAVSVEGFGSADVTLSVWMNLGSPVNACSIGEVYGRFAGRPVVSLTRTTGATGVAIDDTAMVPLTAPPGGSPNATAGIWSGVWKVTSPRAGTWTVTRVDVCTTANAPGGWRVDPRTAGIFRTVTVTGTNVPRISVSTSTVVWGSPQIIARVAVRDGSGNPVAGREVAFGQDNTCGADGDAGTLVATAANGVAAAVMDPNVAMCAYLTTPAAASMVIDQNVALLYQRGIAPRTLFRYVTAMPLRTSLPRRTTLIVTGSVNPSSSGLGYPVTVTLYKQVAVSSWKPVGSAVGRSSGRYTVTTKPQTRGRFYYKVVATSPRPGMVATGSAKFRIRVT